MNSLLRFTLLLLSLSLSHSLTHSLTPSSFFIFHLRAFIYHSSLHSSLFIHSFFHRSFNQRRSFMHTFIHSFIHFLFLFTLSSLFLFVRIHSFIHSTSLTLAFVAHSLFTHSYTRSSFICSLYLSLRSLSLICQACHGRLYFHAFISHFLRPSFLHHYCSLSAYDRSKCHLSVWFSHRHQLTSHSFTFRPSFLHSFLLSFLHPLPSFIYSLTLSFPLSLTVISQWGGASRQASNNNGQCCVHKFKAVACRNRCLELLLLLLSLSMSLPFAVAVTVVCLLGGSRHPWRSQPNSELFAGTV